MHAAELIARARREAGLTQAEMARRAGTSQAAVSAVERGLSDVTIARAERLLAAAGWELSCRPRRGVDPDDLQMMRLNLQKTPAARLEGFFTLLQLRGIARR